MKYFVGTHIHKVDAKGRVSLPSDFRAVLQAAEYEGTYLYMPEKKPYIIGYSQKKVDALIEEITNNPNKDKKKLYAFSKFINLKWDTEGRIILPQPLREKASITKDVTFLGMGEYFEIWEPEAADRKLAEEIDMLDEEVFE